MGISNATSSQSLGKAHGMQLSIRAVYGSSVPRALYLSRIICVGLLAVTGLLMPPRVAAGQVTTPTHTTGMGDGYVGSETCAPCHQGIYRSYRQSDMGKSMLHVTPSILSPAFLQNISVPAHTFNEQMDRHFDVFAHDQKLFQSEYQKAPDGTEIFRDTREIQWIIGAGTNGFGAVVERDGYLFQAPQSFYSKPKTWGPSPGYEQIDLGFNRPIQAGCIFCHSGRPRPIADTNGQFESTPFSELSIGCENCHGPGAAHVAAMKDTNRVNDKSSHHLCDLSCLTPYLADNICMGCHQTGDVRVLKPGKSYQDFHSGRACWLIPLSILMVPPTRSNPPDVDHVEHYYSMTLSKCYRASQGRMSCITCHNPHVEPSSEEAPAYFNRKCLTCRPGPEFCKVPHASSVSKRRRRTTASAATCQNEISE